MSEGQKALASQLKTQVEGDQKDVEILPAVEVPGFLQVLLLVVGEVAWKDTDPLGR